MTASSLPAGWPTDRPLAVSVSVMLEGWTDDSAPGIGPMGNPLRAGVIDLQARSWAEYGPKTGSWRLLDLLDGMGVRAVWYVSGIIAELPRPARGHRQGRAPDRRAWLGAEHTTGLSKCG